MTTSTTTFSPKLIIGQQGSGKTYDLVQTAKEFFQQYPGGDAVVFSYDADEYAEVGTDLTKMEGKLAHCGPSEAREFYDLICVVDSTLSDRIVGSIYKAAPILILVDELIGLGDRLNRGEADHLSKIFDRIAREGGKYGIYIVAATHTCKQAPHEIRLGDSFEWVETSKSIQAELRKRIEQEMEKAGAIKDRFDLMTEAALAIANLDTETAQQRAEEMQREGMRLMVQGAMMKNKLSFTDRFLLWLYQ